MENQKIPMLLRPSRTPKTNPKKIFLSKSLPTIFGIFRPDAPYYPFETNRVAPQVAGRKPTYLLLDIFSGDRSDNPFPWYVIPIK